MKRLLLAVLTTFMLTPAWADVEINETNFPDDNFRSVIMWSAFNEDYNDVLTDQEIANATSLTVSGNYITNLKGIEFFTALKELSCYGNQLNIEAMDALIASLPEVSNGKLYVSYSYTPSEGNLCTADHIAAAKAKGWTAYDSDGNEFAGIVVLCKIDKNSFPDENFRTYLVNNYIDSNGDGYLTDTEATIQTYMDLSDKGISSLKGIEFFTQLTTLYCYHNQLTSLDVSKNTALTTLYCYGNKITGAQMGTLVSSLPKIENGQINILDLSNEDEANTCSVDQVNAIKAKGWEVYYRTSYSWETFTGVLPILIDEDIFPDENFRSYLTNSSVDYDQDGRLSTSELSNISSLDVSGKGISNLKGIELFTKLTTLYCYGNKITGAQMDALTASLPIAESGQIYVLDLSNDNEANTCSVEQVNAIKAKGWEVYYRTSYNWETFTGVLPILINEDLFPDENFRSYLTSTVDYDQDGRLSISELSITSLNLSNLGISNLKGIELFTELTLLECRNNALTSIDVSKNGKLTTLDCYSNPLKTIDVSKNTKLEKINCGKCQLSSLDVSKNLALTKLYCHMNNIKGEEMNALIESLPQIVEGSLYVYAQYLFDEDNAQDNNIILQKHIIAAKGKGWDSYFRSGWSKYEKDGLWGKYDASAIPISEDYFPDEDFRSYISTLDSNKDEKLSKTEIANIKSITCSGVNNLQGIEFLTEITTLNCSNSSLTSLDLSENTKLTSINCSNCGLTALDLSKNIALKELNCSNNQLATLDLSKNVALTVLRCGGNQINFAQMDALIGSLPYTNDGKFYVINYTDGEENLCTTDQSAAAKAKGWTAFDNNQEYEGFSGNVEDVAINADSFEDEYFRAYIKENFDKDHNNSLSVYERIKYINITLENASNIKSLKGIELFPKLTNLTCTGSQITTLDLSQFQHLDFLDLHDNKLTDLKVPNIFLIFLDCRNNQLTTLEYRGEGIAYLLCDNNQLTSLIISGVSYLNCSDNKLTTISISSGLETLYCRNNPIKTLDLSSCKDLYELDCSNTQLSSLDVTHNEELYVLNCDKNNLTSLDLSKNHRLGTLVCDENNIKTLDLSENKNLWSLYCAQNLLTSLDLTSNNDLRFLRCGANLLSELVLPTSPLEELSCFKNKLTSLNISNNIQLTYLDCCINQLTTLDVSKNTKLNDLRVYNNELSSLNVSENKQLNSLYCFNNKIKCEAMGVLVNSLPIVKDGKLYVISASNNSGEENECTSSQVETAKEKGWTTYQYVDGQVEPFAGTDNEVTIGDVNGDGEKNEADVKAIINYIMGIGQSKFIFAAADVNGDKKINVADIVVLQNLIKK